MSAANEPDFASCASMGPPCTVDYVTMLYTANEMVDFVKVLGPKLKALNSGSSSSRLNHQNGSTSGATPRPRALLLPAIRTAQTR